MKRILSLLLSVFIASCMLVIAVSAAETDVTIENSTVLYSFAECHEMLHETLAENDLQNVDSDGVPYAIVHCQSNSQIGRYIEEFLGSEQIGYETRACAHDVQGSYDIQYQYLDSYKAYCTLCDYTSRFSRLRLGTWNCIK